MSASLQKHHVKGLVHITRFFVMENASRGLYNVMVNVCIIIIRLLVVMERAQILLKIGGAILNVSPVKNLAMENALKVNLNF